MREWPKDSCAERQPKRETNLRALSYRYFTFVVQTEEKYRNRIKSQCSNETCPLYDSNFPENMDKTG